MLDELVPRLCTETCTGTTYIFKGTDRCRPIADSDILSGILSCNIMHCMNYRLRTERLDRQGMALSLLVSDSYLYNAPGDLNHKTFQNSFCFHFRYLHHHQPPFAKPSLPLRSSVSTAFLQPCMNSISCSEQIAEIVII